MELISWSLNAIDKIFSPRSGGMGEPACSDGTYYAGYSMDAWNKWKVVCLAVLSVEDIEDVYLFGTLITGILLISSGITLVYRKICKLAAAIIGIRQLLEEIKKHSDDAGRDRMELHQKVGLIEELLTQSLEKNKKLDYILGQTGELCRRSVDTIKKIEEFEALLKRLVRID